jgi:hypothetical protein
MEERVARERVCRRRRRRRVRSRFETGSWLTDVEAVEWETSVGRSEEEGRRERMKRTGVDEGSG